MLESPKAINSPSKVRDVQSKRDFVINARSEDVRLDEAGLITVFHRQELFPQFGEIPLTCRTKTKNISVKHEPTPRIHPKYRTRACTVAMPEDNHAHISRPWGRNIKYIEVPGGGFLCLQLACPTRRVVDSSNVRLS